MNLFWFGIVISWGVLSLFVRVFVYCCSDVVVVVCCCCILVDLFLVELIVLVKDRILVLLFDIVVEWFLLVFSVFCVCFLLMVVSF